jgi:hypothetical protein
MFTFLDLGIFVAVGNVLILKVKILFYPNSVTKHDMEDNLSCTPAEIREIAKNTVANLLPDKS